MIRMWLSELFFASFPRRRRMRFLVNLMPICTDCSSNRKPAIIRGRCGIMISRLVKAGGQGGPPWQKVVCACRIGFSTDPSLSHHFRLSAIQHAGAGERYHQLRGWWCVLRLQKPVRLRHGLRFSLGYWMIRWAFRVFQEFFRVKSGCKMLLSIRW